MIPRPPWYNSFERALRPVEGHETVALVAIAAITLVIAWKGDAATKFLWLLYLISP